MCVGFHRGAAALPLFLSLSLTLSLLPCCFRGFFYNTFNLLCSSARSPQARMYFCLVFQRKFIDVCVCVSVFVYKLCVSFSAVECPIQVPASYSLSFSRVFSQSCCLFPHTQRFLRAALIFAAARGHYQLIDYFDCYLIPSGAHMCKCAVSVSLALSVCPRVSLCFAAQVRELSTHQPIRAAHLVLCASVSHFRPCRAVQRRVSICRDLGHDTGSPPGPGGQGKSILHSPLPRFSSMVCHHTHDSVHTQTGRDTPEQPTHQHRRNLSTFLFFFPSHSAGTWGFNGFLHTLEFFRASSPFSRISICTLTHTRLRGEHTPYTISK